MDDWEASSPTGEAGAERSRRPGGSGYDWGLGNRLGRIFDSNSGNTVMLAFDHGYFQGPTSGLEDLGTAIPPLVSHVDALMCTRGALRSSIDSSTDKAVVLRMTGGQSVLTEISNEAVTVSVRDAVRMNATAMAVQVYVGSEHEHNTIVNLSEVVNAGIEYGIPTLGVIGVGRDMVRDARYFGLATRIAAEMGAQLIKSYYIDEGFDQVVRRCPVPIIIAGGKKLPEDKALDMSYRAIQEGAAGVDMGRNIFQSVSPVAMVQAVRSVVHDGQSAQVAFEMFQDLANDQ